MPTEGESEASGASAAAPDVAETFSEEISQGRVVGSTGAGGIPRRGRDLEHQISIDHGCLRFRPLIEPGWGREGVAYGPFRRKAGLTFSIAITNGHNTSQGGPMAQRFSERVKRWARGSASDPLLLRAFELLRGPRKRGLLRRLRWWSAIARGSFEGQEIDENLALGWFSGEAPGDPSWDGCYFMMHAAEGENGELWARVGGRFLSAFRGVRNIRIYYVVALRERGAIYYAAASSGAPFFSAYPKMRPIAVDPFDKTPALYAGVHQSALGQIGWRVDTLVHGLRIETVPSFTSTFGAAHVGETLKGEGALGGTASTASPWKAMTGTIDLTADGAVSRAGGEHALAATDPGTPSGLVHALVASRAAGADLGLVCRLRDADNFWLLRLTGRGCELTRIVNGVRTVVAEDGTRRLVDAAVHSVQIVDAQGKIGCYLDGERLFASWCDDASLDGASGVGLWFSAQGGASVCDLEAHPREVAMPAARVFSAPWRRFGDTIGHADDFAGVPRDLIGRTPQTGSGEWLRSVGHGAFEITGAGSARVRGDVHSPHPGRTLYTLPWSWQNFADLEVTITPPGTDRGQGHRGRAGLVFWEDRRNYLSLSTWLEDKYDGASISVFPKRHGFEELYDAVWTMIGTKVYWGRSFRLRCSFDGDNFLILVDDEPIMERALSDLYPGDPPLQIRRVGLATNWEWGRDTGSRFETFRARR